MFLKAYVVGVHELYVPSPAFRPHPVSGCGFQEDLLLSAGRYITGMPFDATNAEYAQFSLAMPKSWNEGTVTAQFYWTNTAGGSGNVVWAFAGVAAGDNETLDAAVGTAQSVTDGALTAKYAAVSSETSAITIGGTPVASDLCRFVAYRDAGNGSDSYGSDAYLLGVKLRFTVDAPTDD